jgi:NADH-quinone oxidoreductase subunit L
MTRLVVVVFLGNKEYHHPPHESPKIMTVPLIILAILSVVSGWGGFIPHLIPDLKVEGFIHKVSKQAHISAIFGSFAFAVCGILFSLLFYMESVQLFNPENWKRKLNKLYNLLFNRYYIDDKIVNGIIIKGLLKFEEILANFDLFGIDKFVDDVAQWAKTLSFVSGNADLKGVDGLVDRVGETVLQTGEKMRVIQTGNIKQYISWVLGGAAIIVVIAIIVIKIYH